MLIVEYVNYIGLIVLEVTFWEETGMEVQHTIFNKETDSEKLAMDIVEFLKNGECGRMYRFLLVENAIKITMVNLRYEMKIIRKSF